MYRRRALSSLQLPGTGIFVVVFLSDIGLVFEFKTIKVAPLCKMGKTGFYDKTHA